MAVFVGLMFIAFFFVLLASFFRKTTRGNIIYRIVTYWSDAALFLWGMHHKNIYRAPFYPGQPVIFIFNHISYLDIPILLKAFRQQPIRVLGKAELAGIPVFGFMYRSAAIMVDRSSAEGRAKSVADLKTALAKNISVVIAPEGTFNMTGKPLKDFYDGAFRIAIETNTNIRPVIFLDAFDRLNYKSIFSFTPGRSRAVFLEAVDVSRYNMGDLPKLKQELYQIMETALIENKASWIGKQ